MQMKSRDNNLETGMNMIEPSSDTFYFLSRLFSICFLSCVDFIFYTLPTFLIIFVNPANPKQETHNNQDKITRSIQPSLHLS